ncbi:LLM class flavin-dependent oxidoreductase [Rhodovarius crocodyli]|uniref:LLM class flavin-dependent oxidoreductase n=1 Tax=Rhodovarius crocodyli TaxID=1979269 RepID=A0A437LW75_9PROT|nr:LLM class flavin-dependent oxidoreductase [Rhodovarius crocodyli]RVT89648.1 LLM class flavin-dependent oxidoreductase [Rhodovarius crocodyli]
MPVKVIGMIGVDPPKGTTLHVIAGGVSASFLKEFAQTHENAGFDHVLVGYYSSSAEGFNVASYAAAHTKTLSYLIAHRPGVVSPTLAARSAATFDHLSNGRLLLHIISGVTDKEQESEGDFLKKDDRYRRAAEYLGVMRRLWTADAPFDHHGEFYRFNAAWTAVKPLQKPYPKLFFGGASEGALEMGAEHCDSYALYGEPLKETADRMADFRARAAKFGRTPGFNISFRPIIAPTEGEAWDKARRILADMENANLPRHAQDKSAERMLAIAARGDVHDERLYLPIAKAVGAKGNTSCLVGTPQQVADAMLKYYRMGVQSFLIRGFDPVGDTTEFGRELIPALKEGALAIDRETAVAA